LEESIKMAQFPLLTEKKNLVKPPHGEYIAPERLEAAYKNCDMVENIVVYACAEKNEVVALVQPNKRRLQQWATDKGIDMEWSKLCNDDRASKAVLGALKETWKETHLRGFELIQAVALYSEEWTTQNGWLTAALKLQRQKIHTEQRSVIQGLYKQL